MKTKDTSHTTKLLTEEINQPPQTQENFKEVFINKKRAKHRAKIEKLLRKQNIKYRGIFSYRTVRILGYIFLLFAQICIALSLISKYTTQPQWVNDFAGAHDIISIFALPLFLTANFCVIMKSQEKIKKLLITYSVIAIGIYLLVILGFYRYTMGISNFLFKDDPASSYAFADSVAKNVFGKFINYNVFVDLALFCLFYFFLFYNPKNIKKKGSLLAFRSLSVLPLLAIVAATLLYGFYYRGDINLPVAVLAIMPCRSLIVYLIFFILAIVIKIRQKIFLKWGGSEIEYDCYIRSNRSSLEVSILASIIISVLCLIDFLFLLIFPKLILFGAGFNFYLALIIPFIFLFSYTRTPKKSSIDKLFIFIFIFLTIILYLETGLYIISHTS